ncbi:DUF5926 family protein [Corynebacterium alimapuense]|uniref:Preprotein translocase subunit SecA n=1 Tax=Corynebacterium alimapuense TaxID=1576874 RepID=A0A3M8K9X3_9CORY|nr:DUF5926 family protein [Corynebacterium alimapuense]RNE50011.1 preprotein translocase subunit SecA [Corynebacterium alimapuense]
MAKKNKKNENLPEGMSRRQAKLAARAAERAALEREPRPYGGLSAEADLIALQEFVPSAVAKIEVKGIDRDVYIVTVLPGGGAALVREDNLGGAAFVALQLQIRSQNPGRDLAYALNWVANAQPGQTLESASADGTEPKLTELIAADAALEITEHQDFNWWIPEGSNLDAMTHQAIQNANESVVESHRIEAEVPGALWWVNPGGKAHIRWIRTDNEDALLTALARIAARGDLNLGENTRFAGVFRTHGLLVPVFDLDPEVAYDSYGDEIVRLSSALEIELSNDQQLTADERRQLQNIKSRQVTIR